VRWTCALAIVAASASPAIAQMYTEPDPLVSNQPVNTPGNVGAILRNPATMNTTVNSLLVPPCVFNATFSPSLPWMVNGIGQFSFSVVIDAIGFETTEQCVYQIVDTIGVGGTITVRVIVGGGAAITISPDPIDISAPVMGSTVVPATATNNTGLIGNDPLYWDWIGTDADQFRMVTPCNSAGMMGCTSNSFGPPPTLPFQVACEPTTSGPKAATLLVVGMFGGMGYGNGAASVTCNSTAPGPDANTTDAVPPSSDADPNAPDADPTAPDGSGGGLVGETTNFYACGCNGNTARATGFATAIALLALRRKRRR
jgi:hypothetical protein